VGLRKIAGKGRRWGTLKKGETREREPGRTIVKKREMTEGDGTSQEMSSRPVALLLFLGVQLQRSRRVKKRGMNPLKGRWWEKGRKGWFLVLGIVNTTRSSGGQKKQSGGMSGRKTSLEEFPGGVGGVSLKKSYHRQGERVNRRRRSFRGSTETFVDACRYGLKKKVICGVGTQGTNRKPRIATPLMKKK